MTFVRISAVILLLFLSGCKTLEEFLGKPNVVISDYCEIAGIMEPSRKDTPGTLRQIAANNKKYRDLCGGGNAGNAK